MQEKPRTTRQQQSLETSQALLEVSLDLFVRKGFAGTTVRDIASAANVSPGLMFHYFPSKDALLQAHVKQMAAGMASVAEQLKTSTSPLDTLRSIAQQTLQSFNQPFPRNQFLLAAQVLSLDSIPAAAKKMLIKSRTLDATAALIARGQSAREIRKGDARALAISFWGAIQGIAEILAWNPKAPVPDPEWIMGLLH